MRSGDKNPKDILEKLSSQELRDLHKKLVSLDDINRGVVFKYEENYNSPFNYIRIVIKDVLGDRALE